VKTRFEWDREKARINLRKHRVSFELATRVFADPLRLTDLDQIVEGEIRWKTIGIVEYVTVLVVVHGFRDSSDEEAIRIISARRATRWERRRYEEEEIG
jgi:hypothetical protein